MELAEILLQRRGESGAGGIEVCCTMLQNGVYRCDSNQSHTNLCVSQSADWYF